MCRKVLSRVSAAVDPEMTPPLAVDISPGLHDYCDLFICMSNAFKREKTFLYMLTHSGIEKNFNASMNEILDDAFEQVAFFCQGICRHTACEGS